MSKAWQGDWHERIYRRIQQRGFDTATAFAESLPCKAWREMAKELGYDDIAAVQLRAIVYDEALKRGNAVGFARDAIVRELHKYIPGGWSIGDDFQFKAARAYAAWITSLGETYTKQAERAWDWLEAQDIPEGWLPQGPDDPWIEAMFRETGFPGAGEPHEPKPSVTM